MRKKEDPIIEQLVRNEQCCGFMFSIQIYSRKGEASIFVLLWIVHWFHVMCGVPFRV